MVTTTATRTATRTIAIDRLDSRRVTQRVTQSERGDDVENENDQVAADLAALEEVLRAGDDHPDTPRGPDGLPDLEAVPVLREARANAQRIAAELSAAKGRRRELAEALGVKPKIDPAKFDAIAAQLIAAGKPTDTIEQLEAALKLVRRLEAAREVAEVKVSEAYQRAVGAIRPAVEEYMGKFNRAVALAHVALVRAESVRLAQSAAVRAAGLVGLERATGPQLYSSDRFATRQHFQELVGAGVLNSEDVADLID